MPDHEMPWGDLLLRFRIINAEYVCEGRQWFWDGEARLMGGWDEDGRPVEMATLATRNGDRWVRHVEDVAFEDWRQDALSPRAEAAQERADYEEVG